VWKPPPFDQRVEGTSKPFPFSSILKSQEPVSEINAENQQITKQTSSFIPNNVKLGVFGFI